MNAARIILGTSIPAALALASSLERSHLELRAYTGPACNSTFVWTDNQQNISPCQLAATVYGSCSGPSWDIPALTANNHYNTPAGSFVTQCSCSWLAYNLISACTLCQGQEQSIMNWPFYSTNCSGETSSTYFPSTQVLPDGTSIPYYAQTDPTDWNDERFNLEQAIELHNQGKPDVVVSASTPKKSSKVGPIVGGVVGGIAVILLAAGVAFYLQRRKKQSRDDYATNKVAHSNGDGPGHARTVSDLSTKSNLIGFGYQQLDRSFATSPSSPPPMSVTSGTMHTHTGSVNSLSYFGSVSHSVSPYGAASPPPTIARTLSPSISPPPVPSLPTQPQAALNREDIIVPFTLPPSDTNSSSHGHPTDRKRADGAIIPVFDPPNSFPVAVAPATESGETSASGSRPRVNPPAYSVVDQASIAPSRSHAKKGSGDTQFSIDSATSGVQPSVIQRHGHGAGGGSISAIDDVIGHMGFGSPTDSVSAGGTLGTGLSGQYNQPTFRRVVGNPDP